MDGSNLAEEDEPMEHMALVCQISSYSKRIEDIF